MVDHELVCTYRLNMLLCCLEVTCGNVLLLSVGYSLKCVVLLSTQMNYFCVSLELSVFFIAMPKVN